MNYLLLMEDAIDWCLNFSTLMTIVGYVIFAIKVIVPIILIVTGMITLAKAVASGSDDEKKKATKTLVNKVVFAIAVFLVVQIVSIIIGLVSSNSSYKACSECALHPFSGSHEIKYKDAAGKEVTKTVTCGFTAESDY